MSLTTLISRLQLRAQGSSRPDIRTLIQAAQDDLFSDDVVAKRFVGSAGKGFPPYLITVAGTYRYEVKTANLSEAPAITVNGTPYTVLPYRVMKVFIDSTGTLFGRVPAGSEYPYRYGNPIYATTQRMTVADVPVRSESGTESAPPIIDFFDDPGDTTTKFFIEFTYLPPRLTSESIPLFVPVEFEKALYDYAMGEIQEAENGKPNEYQQRYETYWKPKFISRMAMDAGKNANETIPLDC